MQLYDLGVVHIEPEPAESFIPNSRRRGLQRISTVWWVKGRCEGCYYSSWINDYATSIALGSYVSHRSMLCSLFGKESQAYTHDLDEGMALGSDM